MKFKASLLFSKLKWIDLFFIFLLLYAGYLLSERFFYTGLSYDEDGLITISHFILRGLIPYKDIFDVKPILVYFLNALGILIFGIKDCSFKLMPFLLMFPAIILFYITLVRINVIRRFSFLLALYILIMILNPDYHDWGNNDYETYGIIFSILSFCSFFWSQDKIEKTFYITHIIGGVFLVLAFFCKEPFILGLLPLLIFTFVEDKPLKINQNKFFSLVLGSGSVILLFIMYIVFNGAWSAYIDKLDASVAYVHQYFRIIGGNLVPTTFSGQLEYDWSHLNSGFRNFSVFYPLIPFYLAVVYFNRVNLRIILFILGVIGGLYSIAIGHCFWKHYFLIGVFPLVAPAIWGAKEFSDYLRLKIPGKNSGNVAFIVSLIFVMYSLYHLVEPQMASIYNSPNKAYNLIENSGTYVKNKLLPIVNEYTEKNEKLLLIGQPSLYIIVDRIPATKYFHASDEILSINTKQIPSSKRFALYEEDIEKVKPKIIYIQPNWTHAQKIFNDIVHPYIKRNKYYNCGEGLYLREIPIKESLSGLTSTCRIEE